MEPDFLRGCPGEASTTASGKARPWCYPARAGRSVLTRADESRRAHYFGSAHERTARGQHEPEGRASGSRPAGAPEAAAPDAGHVLPGPARRHCHCRQYWRDEVNVAGSRPGARAILLVLVDRYALKGSQSMYRQVPACFAVLRILTLGNGARAHAPARPPKPGIGLTDPSTHDILACLCLSKAITCGGNAGDFERVSRTVSRMAIILRHANETFYWVICGGPKRFTASAHGSVSVRAPSFHMNIGPPMGPGLRKLK